MSDHLLTPLRLRQLEIPNRLMVSPMCQYSVEECDGVATEWHHVHLGSRAVGGAGLVMTEATAVEGRGRITPNDLGIWNDSQGGALRRTTEFISSQGAVSGIQLAHAGRKGSRTRPWEGDEPLPITQGGWQVVAPSDLPWPYEQGAQPTTRLTIQEIQTIVNRFREGAKRALDAGFDVVEIHAAHGYLLHEFLSPITNEREDDYGGSFENRTRMVREVASAVREVWPDTQPVFVRISATDWFPDRPSWTIEQSCRLADRLYEIGIDLIDVSSAAIHPDSQPPWTGPNYQLALAEYIQENKTTDIAVGAVGGITSPNQAEDIIRHGRAELCIVGREFLRNPYFGIRAAQALGLGDHNVPPVQYHRAY